MNPRCNCQYTVASAEWSVYFCRHLIICENISFLCRPAFAFTSIWQKWFLSVSSFLHGCCFSSVEPSCMLNFVEFDYFVHIRNSSQVYPQWPTQSNELQTSLHFCKFPPFISLPFFYRLETMETWLRYPCKLSSNFIPMLKLKYSQDWNSFHCQSFNFILPCLTFPFSSKWLWVGFIFPGSQDSCMYAACIVC